MSKKSSRKPTGEKKSKKGGETTPAKKRAKKDSATEVHEAPVAAAEPAVVEAPKDPAEELGARHVLDCVRFVLDAAPKVKESPALAFVLVDDDRLIATDDYRHHTAWLGAKVAPSPLKITRASAEAFAAVLAGELKAGEATESAVRLTWRGLIVEIGRATESHEVTLDRFEAGPAPEYMRLAAPKMLAHIMLGACGPDVMGWRGGGVVDVFTAEDQRQLWLQASLGETPRARQVLASRSATLGIRQPTLPGVSTAPTPPAAAATSSADPTPPAGPGAPELTAGSSWAEVRCPIDDAWLAISSDVRNRLAPYRTDGAEVVWGPYPSTAPRLAHVERWLRALGCSPRCVAAEAPDLVTAFLETTPVRELDAPARQLGAGDAIDAEVIDAGDDGEVV